MFLGTWPNGGIAPISYKSLPGETTGGGVRASPLSGMTLAVSFISAPFGLTLEGSMPARARTPARIAPAGAVRHALGGRAVGRRRRSLGEEVRWRQTDTLALGNS